MIVVDTNVLAYLLLPCELSSRADALYAKDPEWAVPIFWRSELRNVLAGYLRPKTLTFDDVVKIQSEAEALVAGNEHEVGSRRVLELVRDSGCTAYDCEFVALAMQLGVRLVAMDKQVLEAFPRHAVALSAGCAYLSARSDTACRTHTLTCSVSINRLGIEAIPEGSVPV